ncbi:epoxyqueuosine reductase [Halobacteriovorax sp. HLS]|uniref:epoxyqueuosine reductase n=1 Tax=Halobacteriovorax sp. HLS TaxID=2234000 RepID=UPI000FDB3CE4|nr:4Fe-4S double cluster binding domain-containing protein [Halobacteriovorax sp. HLS]
MKIDLDKILTSSILDRMNIVDWGLTRNPSPISFDKYDDWVQKGHHGNLKYLEGERKDKRKSLLSIFPEFQSALVFQFSYAQDKFELDKFYESAESNGLRIGGYVFGYDGVDYHHKLKEDLEEIGCLLQASYPGLEYKLSLDIQPVLERDLAYRAGLGWFGKNSMFISKKEGSFFLIGSLLLNRDVEGQEVVGETDHCGQCTRCADACPTDAIDIATRTITSSKCISTYTIEEFKDNAIAPKGMERSRGEIFGCDICQDVCPWNTRLKRVGKYNKTSDESPEKSFIKKYFLTRPLPDIIEDLKLLSNRKYQKIFFATPLQRTGRVGMLKNLLFYSNKKNNS